MASNCFVARFRGAPLAPEKFLRWGQRRCSELRLGADGLAGKWKEDQAPPPERARQQVFANLKSWGVAPRSFDVLTEQQYSELRDTAPVSLEVETHLQRKRALNHASYHAKKRRTEEAAAAAAAVVAVEDTDAGASAGGEADLEQALEALGPDDFKKIRCVTTPSENKPGLHLSAYDVIQHLAKRQNPRQAYENVRESFPEVVPSEDNFPENSFVFPGQGQRPTPIVTLRQAVQLLMLLPGRASNVVRQKSADLFVRYLGGDLALIPEVFRARAAQEALPEEHPARVFGREVEAEQPDMTLVLSLLTRQQETNDRLARQVEDLARQVAQLTARPPAERMQVNLNVTAPRRNEDLRRLNVNLVTPEELQELRRDALPVTVYLKQRVQNREERQRLLVPFSTRLRDLKLQDCRSRGEAPRYVGQLDRAQLLYLRADRPLMDRAFAQVTRGHDDDAPRRPDIRDYFF